MRNRFVSFVLWFSVISLCVGWLSAQEYEPVLLQVLSDTKVWADDESFPKESNYSKIFAAGLMISGLNAASLGTIDNSYVYFDDIRLLDKTEYSIPSQYVSPWLTDVDFPDEWILNLNDQNRKRWVITYYLDVFTSQKRDTILKYENDWIQALTDDYNEQIEQGDLSPWWNQVSVDECLFFFPASISLGSVAQMSFWIIKRTATNDGYHLTVQGDLTYARGEERQLQSVIFNLPFPKYTEKKTFDLVLIPDGDYMDVYLDSMKTKLATFAKVDVSFLPELNKLIANNKCTPGNLTFWPRRADGSMDYPPPKGATNVRFTPTAQELAAYPYTTTSNLRLRSSEMTSANVITIIKQGTRLTILSIGTEETIEGITAPWVQVKIETGETGWCFGGYLDPRP